MNNIFYARSPSGRVKLNVEEIRHRMLGVEKPDPGEELKQIRVDRIDVIQEREGIASLLEPEPTTAVHVLPAAITTQSEHIPANELSIPRPLGETRNGDDMTADSRYAWTHGADEWYAYGFIRNDGLYEAVGKGMFSMWNDETIIKSKVTSGNLGLDVSIIVAVKRGLSALAEVGFTEPLFAFVSLSHFGMGPKNRGFFSPLCVLIPWKNVTGRRQ